MEEWWEPIVVFVFDAAFLQNSCNRDVLLRNSVCRLLDDDPRFRQRSCLRVIMYSLDV